MTCRPPVPVGVDSRGQVVPGEVPKLFGGDIVEYIMATGCGIPLIVESCVRCIETEGKTHTHCSSTCSWCGVVSAVLCRDPDGGAVQSAWSGCLH